jgi:hypothetical protein
MTSDPNDARFIDSAELDEAVSQGRQPIVIFCYPQGATSGDQPTSKMLVFGSCVPRAGEKLRFQEGPSYRVASVDHVFAEITGRKHTLIMPIVRAEAISPG